MKTLSDFDPMELLKACEVFRETGCWPKSIKLEWASSAETGVLLAAYRHVALALAARVKELEAELAKAKSPGPVGE